MTDATPLDTDHAAMEAAPEDNARQLRFYQRLAESELYLLLTDEPQGDDISPEIFDVADGRFVLAFDRADRLAQFAGRAVPYVALPGRVLAQMLAGQGVGLGLNLDVAPSAMLIPAEAVAWLNQIGAGAPDPLEARIAELSPPTGLPEALLPALDARLATAAGLAGMAYLAGVTYDSGARSHLLAFIDAPEAAQPALARAVATTLAFSGLEAGMLDVAFFAATDPVAASLARVGLRFDLPNPPQVQPERVVPGSDPDKPPILR